MGSKKKDPHLFIDYDSPWKDVVEDLFEDFLAYFFPDIHKDIDFTRECHFLNGELRKLNKDNKVGKRYTDVLARVYLKSGTRACVFVHVEVQQTRDNNFPERMFIYNYRAFDRYKKKDEKFISLAVLTDENENWRPDEYSRKCWGFQMLMKYPMVKLIDYIDVYGIEKSYNPMALVVLAHVLAYRARRRKDDDERLYSVKRRLFTILFSKRFEKKLIQTLIKFIDWLIQVPEELERKLCEDIEALKEEHNMKYVTSFERIGRKDGKKEGIKIGEKKGRQKTLLKIAKRMARQNFPVEVIARCTKLNENEIRALA